MPKPTQEQLEKINRFTQEPLTEEDVYVFPNMMIDDQPTAYSSRLHPNLLRKFVRDANRGVGLLMNHNNRSLPVGRSFSAEVREEYSETGDPIQSVYGNFYIDLGRKTESGMTTDDLVKGINSGTIFDTSVGFNADKWDCSICDHDIRDWMNCSHFPGETYEIKGDDGVHREETCYVIAGSDGGGELLENSLVYAGACDRATIKHNFSVADVKENKNSPKLHLVDNFKNIPADAKIYQYYTADGSVLFTETDDRTDGLSQLKKRSEEVVEFTKFKEVTDQFGLKFETPEELTSELQQLSQVKEELATKTTEFETLSKEKADLDEELSQKESTITELTTANEALTEKAELANTYRQDLTTKALEAGVRAQGNAFSKDMYEKFLGTLSIDEIKEVISGFENEAKARFSDARTTAPKEGAERTLGNAEPQSEGEFESEEAFRAHVADKAVEYSQEHGVSLKEATKLMYTKYSNGSEA